MASSDSDVCPTEDAVKAFLEYLVDPMLPAKPSLRDNPSPSQQQSLAKQVHSVVLLYNYYHRKQHSELAFLAFDEFCKLAVVLRPTLLAYLGSMQKPDETETETEVVDVEKKLSLTEEKIMNACDICKCLDASKSVPDIEGWPISKVAVLLIDSKKENCFLLFSSITEGVWSVVEKDVDTPSQSSEVITGARYTYKKKRVIKKPTKNELNAEEDGFLQVGYSAVKEAAGVNKTDIMLLESHTVYSQSKEKTASRFYIMKCTQLVNQESIQVPIKDLIESLQGPLVKRSSSSWAVAPVVEYFHVLPYSEIISGWISRDTFSNSLQDSKMEEKNMMVGSPEVTKSYVSNDGMSIGLDNMPSSDTIEALNQKENNGSGTVTWSGSVKGAQDMDVDNALVSPSEDKEECQHIAITLQVNEDQEIENPSEQHYSDQSKSFIEVENTDSTRMLITEGITKDQTTCDKICAKTSSGNNSIEESALIANHSSLDIAKLQTLVASEGKTFTQTALNPLIENRNGLVENTDSTRMLITEGIIKDQTTCDKICAKTSSENNSIEESALIANHSSSDLVKLQTPIASEGKTFTQTALNPLTQKRNGLVENTDSTRMLITEGVIKDQSTCDMICAKTSFENNFTEDCALIANHSSSDLEKLQTLIASKEKTLTQTALNALTQKRNVLVLQQRMIEDQIALCDKKIETMLTSGEDDLELKIESIIEGCNDTWVRNQGRMRQHLEDECLPPYIKRRRLTEAVLIMQSPCQELDDICHKNNWLLPIYRLSQSDGGFQANVAVKGLDFECSCGGNLCCSPGEARESAASQMLTNLRSMAKSEQ